MITFHLRGYGRERGAIGCWYWIHKTYSAVDLEAAKGLFRADYETMVIEEVV